jgi:hypothetical protein
VPCSSPWDPDGQRGVTCWGRATVAETMMQ